MTSCIDPETVRDLTPEREGYILYKAYMEDTGQTPDDFETWQKKGDSYHFHKNLEARGMGNLGRDVFILVASITVIIGAAVAAWIFT